MSKKKTKCTINYLDKGKYYVRVYAVKQTSNGEVWSAPAKYKKTVTVK